MDPKKQTPTIGRAVHFFTSSEATKPEHATVCDVIDESTVNLDITSHEGVHRGALGVKYNETGHGWRWPARV